MCYNLRVVKRNEVNEMKKERISVKIDDYNKFVFEFYIQDDKWLRINVENQFTDYSDYALIPVEDFNQKNLTSYSEVALDFVKNTLKKCNINDNRLCEIFESLIEV